MRPQFTWHTPAQVLMGLGKGTAVILVFASLFLGFFALKVETDSSGVSFSDEDSQAYKVHKTFVSAFGIDDYVLIAFDPGFPLTSAELPERLSMVRTQILNLEGISSVFDLGRLSEAKLPGMHSIETPWNRALVERMRNVLPGAAQLVSRDMQTLGIVVGINNEILNGFRLEARIQEIKTVIKDTFPGVQDCYAAGIPVIRAAFERYNL
ncbi:MAG: hypothetical protein MI892_13400, partial [Desulfobacterales bacterium]|nr:hypothetical protein [Desulfobacterales bacterium]